MMKLGPALTLALLASLAGPPAISGAVAAPTMPLAEVHRGQRGYGLSVFQGNVPSRFEVEVVGVIRNMGSQTSYILARLTGQGLEDSGVAAGMSGSPVYLDGRLAGAVAFSWPFSREALAGVTPIGAMRRLLTGSREEPTAGGRVAEMEASLQDLARAVFPEERLGEALARLQPEVPAGGRSRLAWAVAGFGELARSWMARSLGPVTLAGEATDAPALLAPGSSVAGVLVDGDLRMAVVGTVTDRVGDDVLAFGHPFLSAGRLRMPMASAEVVTVLSNELSSFKIANFGRIVGAFDYDRSSGVRGRIGLSAPMLPVDIVIGGDTPRRFALRVADLPGLTSTLMAIGFLGSFDTATHTGGDQGVDLVARFSLRDHPPLVLRQSFDGPGAPVRSAVYVLAVADFLLENRMERAALESVSLEVKQAPRSRTALLVGAHASKTVVRPGEDILVNLDFAAYRGDRFRRSVPVRVPTGLPAGRYSLLVGSGPSIDVAQLTIEQAAPVSFRQALEVIRGYHSRREVVVLGIFGGRGLSVAGEVLPRLPGSIRSLWDAAATGSAVPLRLAIADEVALELDRPIEGVVRIDLEIKRPEPLGSATPPVPAAAETTGGGTAPETGTRPAEGADGRGESAGESGA